MKLLTKFPSALEAEKASELHEDKGVATFISSKRSNALGGYFTGVFHVGLWVVIDCQYADARQLLLDPNHEVAKKLSRAEIAQFKRSVNAADMSGVLKVLFQLLMFAVLFALVVSILVLD